MEKIIKAALAAQYPNASVNALLEVVMGTPNPEIATEMLLGIYQYPVVHTEPHEKCNPSEVNKQFIKYDKWLNKVNYSYNSRKSKYGWYLKTLPINERYEKCLDGYDNKAKLASQLDMTEEEFNENYDKGYCYGPIDTEILRHSYCDLNNWNNGK